MSRSSKLNVSPIRSRPIWGGGGHLATVWQLHTSPRWTYPHLRSQSDDTCCQVSFDMYVHSDVPKHATIASHNQGISAMETHTSAIYNAGTGLIIGDVHEERQHDEDAAPPSRMPEGCEGERTGIDQPKRGTGSEPQGEGENHTYRWREAMGVAWVS